MCQILTLAPLGKSKHTVADNSYLVKQTHRKIHCSTKGARRCTCSDHSPCFAFWRGFAPPNPPYFVMQARSNKTAHQRINGCKKFVSCDLCPWFSNAGGCAPPNPPAILQCKCVARQIQFCKKLRVDICYLYKNAHHRFLKPSFASSYMILFVLGTLSCRLATP